MVTGFFSPMKDNKTLVIDTLRELDSLKLTHQFRLSAIATEIGTLEKEREDVKKKIDMLTQRLQYELDKNKNLLT